jgi:hypothetical protein
MPYDDELYLGTFAGGEGGMAKVSSLGEGSYASAIQRGSFTVDPVTFSRIVQKATGAQIQQGWRQAAWHIAGLRDEQHAAIIAYKVDLTTALYIRTHSEDGKTYKNYLVDAIFPPIVNRGDPTAVEAGAVFDFEIRFIKMIEQTP